MAHAPDEITAGRGEVYSCVPRGCSRWLSISIIKKQLFNQIGPSLLLNLWPEKKLLTLKLIYNLQTIATNTLLVSYLTRPKK